MSRHILVALDESDAAWKAFEYALETHPDASITVLHVIDPAEWVSSGGIESTGYQSRQLMEQAERRAEDLLDRAESEAAERGIEVETETTTDQPKRAIVEYAENNDVDHVVMGTHGRSGISRIFLGSVAEAVLRRTPVPVTIIR